MQENAPTDRIKQLLPDEPFIFGGLLDSCSSSQQFIELATVLYQRYVVKSTTPEIMFHALKLHLCFDDRHPEDQGYEAGLNGFWRLVNLLQFLPDMTFTSRMAVHNPAQKVIVSKPDEVTAPVVDSAWHEMFELGLLSLDEIALLQSIPFGVPEIGFELQNELHEIVAEADLAWPQEKKTLIYEKELFAAQFKLAGLDTVVGQITQETINGLLEGDK